MTNQIQLTPEEILHFASENFCRQARASIPADEKLAALKGNLQLARDTIADHDISPSKAASVFSVLSSSIPKGKEFKSLGQDIIETATRLTIELR